MNAAFIIAARRTPVAPRNGHFRDIEVADLAAAPIRAVLADASLAPHDVDDVVLGNALYAGGNPARVAALAAGLPDTVPAMSVDTQCCGGLDAVMLAAARVAGGYADIVVAGGMESLSRAPLRAHRPRNASEEPRPYSRPPFTPWPDRDPDMIPAAAALAKAKGITRSDQETYAIDSHRKALAAGCIAAEIVEMAGLNHDPFARALSAAICRRLPELAGDKVHAVTAATVAPEADAAAAVLVVSERVAVRFASRGGQPVRIVGGTRRGGNPELPGLASAAAIHELLTRRAITSHDIQVIEIMEAFSAQAIANIADNGLDPARVNRSGGALARGHPIGASGAILAVRLWHELQKETASATGLAAIAAAGGLGSALLLSR